MKATDKIIWKVNKKKTFYCYSGNHRNLPKYISPKRHWFLLICPLETPAEKKQLIKFSFK